MSDAPLHYSTHPALDLSDIEVTVDGRRILGPISWRVERGQHWVVLGPNGGGKSTLVAVASLSRHPSKGEVHVLGHQLGKVDIRQFRSRIGLASAGLANQLRGDLTAGEVVMCGRYAALEPWWHTYTAEDRARASALLEQVGLPGYDDRTISSLSSGERQRLLLARSLMASPDVTLLDEPTAGLDLAGREGLVSALEAVATEDGPSTVFVTHHVEDIPRSATHLLAIANGTAVARGEIGETLTDALLSELFELPVEVERRDGRWSARAASAA